MSSLTTITAELFESLRGKDISVTTASGVEIWRMDSVLWREKNSVRADQPFAAYLHAPVSNNRRQGMCQAALPDGGTIEFFSVPISANADAVVHEVIFN